MTPKKPMLACPQPATLRFPLLASAKLDGIRATLWPEQPLTRALKPIPNTFIRETIQAARLPAVFDGELVVGAANAPDVFTKTTSGVMAHQGRPDFTFWAFDWVPDSDPASGVTFKERWLKMESRTSAVRSFNPWFKVLPHVWVNNEEALALFEAQCIAGGFEGVILRGPDAGYKHGRSTANEHGMMKVKRFEDAEARIVGAIELMHNDNEATTNALGHTSRSSAQAGKRPAGVLGALVGELNGVTFEIGTGFTAQQRADYWQLHLRGELPLLAKFKHFPHGAVDKPRHPVFLGWRDPIDL